MLRRGGPSISLPGNLGDIHAARAELEGRDLEFDAPISKSPSETYQMRAYDPDGNRFEIMRFTDRSFQVVGSIM